MQSIEPVSSASVSAAVADNLSALPQSLQDETVTTQFGGLPRFLKNSAANLVRVGVIALVAILLPAYLTHRLPPSTYGAWVLILQLGAYVGYLDFGVQTAIAKYISEYEARGDLAGCGRCASAGLALMLAASALGILLTGILAWLLPNIFQGMPAALLPQVRIGVLLVGVSLSVNLATSVFSAVFLGLQRYQIPMVTTIATRLLSAAAVCGIVAMHGGVLKMAVGVAIANVIGSALQVGLWSRLARHIGFSLRQLDRVMLREMLAYCAVLTVWSVCMLFITGLDIGIVGHFAFNDVPYYSVANSPTTLILMVIGAVLGPLLPAASALSVKRSATEMGALLLRSTRYSTFILLATGLPVMVGGYLLLRVWVGPAYAARSLMFMHLLLLGNIIRNLCGPYATMVVAVSRQRVATVAAVTEGVVNLGASIWLALHYGAMGVAVGTLIGAVAGVVMHFGLSMRYTRANFAISRTQLLLKGMVRPAALALPSLAIAPLWWRSDPPPANVSLWVVWAVATALIGWFVAATSQDRADLRTLLRKFSAESNPPAAKISAPSERPQ